MTDLQRLRVAWLCWGIPAVVGVACTALFVLTHHLLLAMIGLVLLPVGAVMSVVGGAMICDCKTGPRATIAILLLSNYPLAAYCAWTGLSAGAAHVSLEVDFINSSSQSIVVSSLARNQTIDETFGMAQGQRRSMQYFVDDASREGLFLTIRRENESNVVVLNGSGSVEVTGAHIKTRLSRHDD